MTQFILNKFAGLPSETSLITEQLHSYFSRIFRLFKNTCFKKIDGCFDVLLLFSRIQKDQNNNMDTSSTDLIMFDSKDFNITGSVWWLPNQFWKRCNSKQQPFGWRGGRGREGGGIVNIFETGEEPYMGRLSILWLWGELITP